MKLKFKEIFLRISLLGSICNCLISPSYGMEENNQEERINVLKLKKDTEEYTVHPQANSFLPNVAFSQSMEQLSDDIYLTIFSFLNQRDIPPVSSTSRIWQRLMDTNQLWKGYAERALVVMKGDYSPKRNYKALVKEHCTPSFMGLGTLNGKTSSVPAGTNFDGSMIVGVSGKGNEVLAFRWTMENGMEPLDEGTWSSAHGITGDGSVIVGVGSDGGRKRAFRWTAKNGMESLGTLGGAESRSNGITCDGSVIIGYADDSSELIPRRAFRWTAENRMESLDMLNRWIASSAIGVNCDGSVIVGEATDEDSNLRAFRWTVENGMESLGTLNGGTWSSATAVSFDGSVIIGKAEDGAVAHQWIPPAWVAAPARTYEQRAFRWTLKNGMQSLGTLNKKAESFARGVSFDGSVIVGEAGNGPSHPTNAFRWTVENGMESVEKLLRDKYLLPADWKNLNGVTGITPDGAVLIGYGELKIETEKKDDIFHPHAWRAVLPRGNLF